LWLTYTRVKENWTFFVFLVIFEELLTIKTVARPGSMTDEEARIQNAAKIRKNKKRMLLKTIMETE
jgi:hypothetical protein